MDSVRIKRGIKSDLPTELPLGELAFCTDTRELFVGMGENASLRQVTMNVSDHVLNTLYLSIDDRWKDVRSEYDDIYKELNSDVKSLFRKIPQNILYSSIEGDNIFSKIDSGTIVIFDSILNTPHNFNLSGKSNITFKCEGEGKIIYNNNLGHSLFEISNSNNITFTNILCEIVGEGVFIGNSNGRSQFITINNCRLSNGKSFFVSHAVNDLTITYCDIKGTQSDPIDILNEPYNINVSNNKITDSHGIGIKVYCGKTENSYNVRVNDNYISNLEKANGWSMGIEIHQKVYDIECNNNIINSCRDMGISLSGATKLVCTGNKIENITNGYGTGIEVVNVKDGVINNNVIIETSNHGIIFDKSTLCKCNSNYIRQGIRLSYDNEVYGITIGGTENNECSLDIIDNTILNGTYGIVTQNYIKDLTIKGNTIKHCFAKCVSNHGSNKMTRNTIIIKNNYFDKEISIGTGSNFYVEFNTFHNSQNSKNSGAIYISKNGENIRINNNNVTGFSKLGYIDISSTSEISNKIYCINNLVSGDILLVNSESVVDKLIQGNTILK